MTPGEKAKELIRRFSIAGNACFTKEKQLMEDAKVKACALICVEEILHDKHECGCEQSVVIDGKYQTYHTYWKLVKEEIVKL